MTNNLTGWRKSTRSAQQTACVEVGGAPGVAGRFPAKSAFQVREGCRFRALVTFLWVV
ncbi:DUF397 domain-containing protein [Saccharopolyspora sp. ASAGF58]|uniref:DUF397 domain-containing protein n=1 Tax=Saccharopolyspora sp. ASAGF58 TaxID=2719023 RepID=UPI0014470D09